MVSMSDITRPGYRAAQAVVEYVVFSAGSSASGPRVRELIRWAIADVEAYLEDEEGLRLTIWDELTKPEASTW